MSIPVVLCKCLLWTTYQRLAPSVDTDGRSGNDGMSIPVVLCKCLLWTTYQRLAVDPARGDTVRARVPIYLFIFLFAAMVYWRYFSVRSGMALLKRKRMPRSSVSFLALAASRE